MMPNLNVFGVVSEEQSQAQKDIYTIYGMKGVGKTTCALGFPGRKDVLSFDRKSLRVKTGVYEDDPNIHVYDAIKFLEPGEATYTTSSSKTFDYAIHILKQIKQQGGTDWVVIDGLERLVKVAEMKMRNNENIPAFKGFANMSLWKLRRLYIRQLHELAVSIAKKGVIYTTYTAKDEIIEDGTTVIKADVPKWIDIVMEETDVVIRVRQEKAKDGSVCYKAYIESSKIPALKSGTVQDITGSTLKWEVS